MELIGLVILGGAEQLAALAILWCVCNTVGNYLDNRKRGE